MPIYVKFLTAVALLLVTVSNADAALITAPMTYEFSGSITSPGGTVTAGTPFSGQLTFDLAQPNPGDPNLQNYLYQSLSFDIGSEDLDFFNGSFVVDNDGSFVGDRVDISFGGGTLGGLPFTHGRLRFVNFSNTAISSADLPFNASLEDWDVKQLTVFADGADIIGQLQTFEAAPVPEPSSLLLLVSGIVGVLGYRLKKRK